MERTINEDYCIYGTSEKEDDYLSMVGQNKMFHDNANLIRYWFYGTSDSSWYVYVGKQIRPLKIKLLVQTAD